MIFCITGIDASGKSSIIDEVAKGLEGRGDYVKVMSFPDRSTLSGKSIDNYLSLPKDQRDPVALQALFTTNRIEFVDILRMYAGAPRNHLILSRYWESGLVYGAAEGIPYEWLLQTQTLTPPADIWFYLDISVEESFKRRPERRDHYELDAAYLNDVRDRYLRLFTSPPPSSGQWMVLNGMRDKEDLIDEITTVCFYHE